MTFEPGSIDQIAQVISHAFLLGALSAYVSMLSSRIASVMSRKRGLNSIPEDEFERVRIKRDIPRLLRRLRLQRRALLLIESACGLVVYGC